MTCLLLFLFCFDVDFFLRGFASRDADNLFPASQNSLRFRPVGLQPGLRQLRTTRFGPTRELVRQ